MKPYAEYKETGLDWLPRVPTHWEVVPNLACFEERNERNIENAELLAVTMRRGVIKQSEITTKKDISNQDKSNYKLVCVGDIAYNKMRMWQGAVGKSDYQGIVSPAYIILKPRSKSFSSYFHQLFRLPIYQKQSYRNSYGICDDQLSLRYCDFKRMYVPLPTLDEQKRIVSYLAVKNREIEGYIAAKRKLLERLKELSAAIISRAVTRGLDPNVETKPSGVEWLGEVPEHWEVKRLKFVVRINPTKSQGAFTKNPQGTCVFLPMETISSDGKILRQDITPVDKVAEGFTYFEKSDVVVAKITPCFENGKGAYLKSLDTPFGFGTTEFHVLRPKKNILGAFLYFVTASRTFRIIGAENMTGSAGQKRVPTSFVANYPVCLPPLQEQQAIVTYIENQLSTIREAQTRIEREIELARELWTTLVAEVVTGQVDVSDWNGTDVTDTWSSDNLETEEEAFDEEAVFSEE